MMMLTNIFHISILLLSSIIGFFLVSYYMIKNKNVILLFPLMILGFVGMIKTSLTFFQIQFNGFWIFVESLVVFAFFLILINTKRVTNA